MGRREDWTWWRGAARGTAVVPGDEGGFRSKKARCRPVGGPAPAAGAGPDRGRDGRSSQRARRCRPARKPVLRPAGRAAW